MKDFSIAIAIAVLFIGVQTFAAVSWDGIGNPNTVGFLDEKDVSAFNLDSFDYDTPPGFMTQRNSADNKPHAFVLDGSTTPTAASEFDNAAGWTVEFAVENLPFNEDFGMFMVARDDVAGVAMVLRADRVHFYHPDFDPFVVLGTHVHGGGYHAYKLTMDGSSVEVTVDGVAIGSFGGPSPGPRFAFGDGSSGADADAVWDYVRINVTLASLSGAIVDLQDQIDNIQLSPGPQGPQGKIGPAGNNGTTGNDAPCKPCADVASAAVDLACKLAQDASSISEVRECANVVVNTLLISTNICEVSCDIGADIDAAIDAKLNP
jgi:hypothetical protein